MDYFSELLLAENIKIKRILGRGGFATVYAGTYGGLGEQLEAVAVKVLQPAPESTAASEEEYTRMFLREAACTAQQSHNHIIRCLGVARIPPNHPGVAGLTKTAWAMVLELAEPYTTKTLIVQGMTENRRTYTNLQAYEWLVQIASALAHLHDSHPRIIHRDIKHENVLLKRVPPEQLSGGSSGGGSRGSRLVAKMADLGLHVVLEQDRSVMLRRKSVATNRSIRPQLTVSRPLSQASALTLSGACPAGETPFFSVSASLGPFALATSCLSSDCEAEDRQAAPEKPADSISGTAAVETATLALVYQEGPIPAPDGPAVVVETGSSRSGSSRGGSSSSKGRSGGNGGGKVVDPAGSPPVSARGVVPLEDCTLGLPYNGTLAALSDGGSAAGRRPSAAIGDGLAVSSAAAASAIGGAPAAAAASRLPEPLPKPQPRLQPLDGALSYVTAFPPGAVPHAPSFGWYGRGASVGPPDVGGSDGTAADERPAAVGPPIPPLPPHQLLRNASAYESEQRRESAPALLPLDGDHAETAEYGCGDGGVAAVIAAAAAAAEASGLAARPVRARSAVTAAAAAATAGRGPGPAAESRSDPTKLGSSRQLQQVPLPLSPPAPSIITVESLQPPVVLPPDVDTAEAETTAAAAAVASAEPILLHAAAEVATGPNSCASLRAPNPPKCAVPRLPSAAALPVSLPDDFSVAGGAADGAGGATSMPLPRKLPYCVTSGYRSPTASATGAAAAGGSSDGYLALAQQPAAAAHMYGTGAISASGMSGGGGAAAARYRGKQRHVPVMHAVSAPEVTDLLDTAPTPTLESQRSIGTILRQNPDLVQPVRPDTSLASGMRRVKSVLRQFQQTELREIRCASIEWVFGLTGRAGSCMYMAPEVFRKLPYNEKADVFSFAVLMYELLSRELLIISYFNTSKGAKLGLRQPEDYAEKVAEGFRPPRPACIPDAVWALVEECWHDDPVQRPAMSEVAARLARLRGEEAACPTDPPVFGGCATGCTVQ